VNTIETLPVPTAKGSEPDRPTILVVDDLPTNIELLEALLTPRGYHVLTASDGKEALKMVLAFPPDLILLDLMMPEMDGFEVLTHLRRMEDIPYIPTILLTGVQEHTTRIKGLEIGADDFLNKPVVFAELIARVKSLLRLKNALSDLERSARENARLAELLNFENTRMAQQLDETRISQMRLLPVRGPDYPGITFSAYYSPALEVGGDYYDYFEIDRHRVMLVIGDAVGKGGAAVLQVSIMKSLLTAEFSTMRQFPPAMVNPSPAKILERMNKLCCTALQSSGIEMTLGCLLIDLNAKTIQFASAGHHYPLIVRGNQVIALEQRGLPVGLFEDAQYTESSIDLQNGDKIVLYSDGIIERMNRRQEFFQIERLTEVLSKLDPVRSNPFDTQNQVLEALFEFSGNITQSDDETLVVFEFDTTTWLGNR
jgi:phosphoserine phosphatase RsbU/P